MEMMQQARTRFLGLDVHRATIAVALAEFPTLCGGSHAEARTSVRRSVRRTTDK
jgi:hypothetical protein